MYGQPHRTTRLLSSAPAFVLAFALALVPMGLEGKYKIFIPYVPTPDHIVDRMLELAEVGAEDFVIDLGSGDGRIPIAAAKNFGARALGVDIDPQLIHISKQNAAEAGVSDRVTFRQQDLFDTDLGDATVVTLYVLTQVNLKLRPRLLTELRPGTRVVSHAFSMGQWIADTHEDFHGVDIYLWIIPAQVAGEWEVTDGERRFRLTLEQHFQEIKGTASIDGRTAPLREASLRGAEIEFAADLGGDAPVRFRGKIEGDRMSALADTGAARPWSAVRSKMAQ